MNEQIKEKLYQRMRNNVREDDAMADHSFNTWVKKCIDEVFDSLSKPVNIEAIAEKIAELHYPDKPENKLHQNLRELRKPELKKHVLDSLNNSSSSDLISKEAVTRDLKNKLYDALSENTEGLGTFWQRISFHQNDALKRIIDEVFDTLSTPEVK